MMDGTPDRTIRLDIMMDGTPDRTIRLDIMMDGTPDRTIRLDIMMDGTPDRTIRLDIDLLSGNKNGGRAYTKRNYSKLYEILIVGTAPYLYP